MERPFTHTGFNQYLAEHKLMGSRCQNCASLFLPPRSLCPNCHATDIAWFEFSGQGEIIGFTTIYAGLSIMQEEGYNRERPYCVGVIRLVEGATVAAQIVDADCDHPEELRVGARVFATFIDRNGKVSLGFERRSS